MTSDMANSKRIAGRVGPTLIALSLSEDLKAGILGMPFPRHRPAVVTLVGWEAMGGGLFRVFAPGVCAGRGSQWHRPPRCKVSFS